jgi:hypothetical protein
MKHFNINNFLLLLLLLLRCAPILQTKPRREHPLQLLRQFIDEHAKRLRAELRFVHCCIGFQRLWFLF